MRKKAITLLGLALLLATPLRIKAATVAEATAQAAVIVAATS